MDMGYMKPNKLIYHPIRMRQYLEDGNPDPISVKLYLTEKCNLACDYCVYKDRISAREMTQEDFQYIAGSLFQMGVRSIVLTGGEPSMHDKIQDMVSYAHFKYGFDMGLITNGVLYNGIWNFKWVRFSVDTIRDATYEKIKGKACLQKVLANVEIAIEDKRRYHLDTTIGVQMVVTEDNHREILEFLEYFSEMDLDYCQIRPVENARYKTETINFIWDQLEVARQMEGSSQTVLTDYKWSEVDNNYKKSYEGCPGAKFIGAVGVNGDFHICCTFMNHPDSKYGNLIKDRGPEILKNRDQVLKKFDYSKCPVGCQGSLINKYLIGIKKIKHRNFI